MASALAALAIAASSPALAYVAPATTVLRDAAKAREGQPASVEARGHIQLGSATPIPATLWLKPGGRCRLELALPGATPAERPTAVVRNGRIASARAMENAPAALAMADAVCTLLAVGRGEASERAWVQGLAHHGVSAGAVSLGHLGPRVAYVLGGPASAPKPQAWLDKQTMQPIRLVAELAGAVRDVRLLDWSAAPAAFPRKVEVWQGDQLEAQLTVDRVVPNPRVPDSMF